MDRARWERIEALLDELLDLEGDTRRARLERLAGDDADLRDEVERLLAADSDPAQGVLDGGLDRLADPLLEDSAPEAAPGRRIGPYRVAGELGRGGMGQVLLAERADGDFEQRVALKIVRGGLNRGEIARRFRHERRILARLRHPNIATLHDGGVTEDGLPYFAMEFVEGTRITDYCDEHRLDLEARVELFEAVCRAVQHAHRNLVVHRDLKPSNVLVTRDGTVKLLDFGIAKVVDPAADGEADGAEVTATSHRFFTPAYAAPEQVLGEPTSTLTDVYSLGVLLYELLTGRNPHGDTSRRADLERSVVETDPASASSVVTGPAAAARRARPEALRRRLRGDLDNILHRALRKEPEGRYASAEELRADLERWRRQLPVSARPATWRYRAAKFVRRHRVAAAALAAGSAAIVLGMAGIAWQAGVASRERDRARLEAAHAQAVKDYVLEVFSAADPTAETGGDVTARELAERGVARLDERLGDAPELRADLVAMLGTVFLRLGVYDRADSLLHAALAQYREADRPGDVVDMLVHLMDVRRWQGRVDEADALAREAVAVGTAALPADDARTLNARSALGTIQLEQGRYEEAVATFRATLEDARRTVGPESARTALELTNLGTALRHTGDVTGSAEAYEEAVRIRRLLEPEPGVEVARVLASFADILEDLDRLDEAEAAGREAIDVLSREYGDKGHAELAVAVSNLAGVVRRRGAFEEAEALGRQAIAVSERALGPEHFYVAQGWNNLGVTLAQAGDRAGAAEAYGTAVRLARASEGPDHPRLAPLLANWANALVADERFADAEATYADALRLASQPGQDPLAAAHVRMGLANVYRKTGRVADSERLLRQAWEVRKSTLGEGHSAELQARVTLASLLVEQRRFDEARPLLDSAIALARTAGAPARGRLVSALEERAILARDAGEPVGMLRGILGDLVAARREANPEDPRIAELEEQIAALER